MMDGCYLRVSQGVVVDRREGEKSAKWQAGKKEREGQNGHNMSIYHRAHGKRREQALSSEWHVPKLILKRRLKEQAKKITWEGKREGRRGKWKAEEK
jgi:hypothetical protein